MISDQRNARSLIRLQAAPVDLQRLGAADATCGLFAFLQEHFAVGDECSLW